MVRMHSRLSNLLFTATCQSFHLERQPPGYLHNLPFNILIQNRTQLLQPKLLSNPNLHVALEHTSRRLHLMKLMHQGWIPFAVRKTKRHRERILFLTNTGLLAPRPGELVHLYRHHTKGGTPGRPESARFITEGGL